MRRFASFVAAAALVLAGSTILASAAPATQIAGPAYQLRTGFVEYEPLTKDNDAVMLARMKGAGASIVRLALSWKAIAPATRPVGFDARDPADPAYDWSAEDEKIRAAVDHGLTPVLALFDAPSWAQPADAPTAAAPNPAAVADFLTATARRYSGSFQGLPRVRYWQIWIEPNVNVYFSPQFSPSGVPVSPTAYRAIVNAAAAAIHAVSPSNVVIAGGLSPFTVERGDTRTIGPLLFMRKMLCMSDGPHPHPTCRTRVTFDVWAHHPYTSGDAQHHAINPDDVSLGDLPKMTALLRAAAAAGHIASPQPVQFWVTEFSWDSNPPDPKAVPVKLLTRWVPEALYTMWKAGVRVAMWLEIRDSPFPSQPVQAGMYYRGASLAEDRPKPILAAFRFPFVAYLGARTVTVWGRTPDSLAHPVRIELSTPGGWTRLATLRAHPGGVFTGRIHVVARPASWVRARTNGRLSPAFSLRRPPDYPVDPFGT